MSIFSLFLCVFNFFLTFFIFVPCMWVVTMGVQSSRFKEDVISTTIVFLFFIFPFVCLISAIAIPILNHLNYPKISIFAGLWPLVQAALTWGFVVYFTR